MTTQEDKQLLLVDLCARLSYGVKVLYEGQVREIQYIEPLYNELKLLDFSNYTIGIEEVKPYLRPMSSMTEDEKNELFNLCTMVDSSVNTYWESFGVRIVDTHPRYADQYYTDCSAINWLNKKMFDYRGLIPKSLALSTEEFNPYKD